MGVRVKVGFKDSVGVQIGQNSIAFGSAPRREVDSQPISLSQASSQSVRNTQFGFFVSGRRGPKQWGNVTLGTKQ